ncbi:FecCD family ABC transporter permease [Amycolatopsis pithecellobii]|uniref:Iron chelate uptake ABC transporter family permease subunit n=1 Tax=Amycolatopsis pithecellobii TaxID=664692 RepID=A0A6N7Z3U5_9PSEU|nr:iron ABC transporter permease [Amycolatopsis pithecellobii]MTD53706.1 iron chelate uptake ABC transporter family permease subunit [Amycolatopsis pithecellobii]
MLLRETGERPVLRATGRYFTVLGVIAAVAVVTALVATGIGPVKVPVGEVTRILANHLSGGAGTESTSDLVVWRFRFPRVLMAAVVGAGLALAGAVAQSVVRNPVADPHLLGLSSGASVGAVLVLTSGTAILGAVTLPAAAFLGSAFAMAVVLMLARQGGRLQPLRLVLVGVVCAHLFSGVTSFLLAQANNTAAQQQIIFWLLGGLSGTQWTTLPVPAIVVVVAFAALLARARQLNVLVLGDDACAALGIPAGGLRRQLLVLATLLTGTVVAVSGGIGFVGLIIGHVARMLVGADHRRALPVTAGLGAIFLMWSDVLARTVISPAELPIGVVTAFLGVPLFLLVMRSRGHRLETSA